MAECDRDWKASSPPAKHSLQLGTSFLYYYILVNGRRPLSQRSSAQIIDGKQYQNDVKVCTIPEPLTEELPVSANSTTLGAEFVGMIMIIIIILVLGYRQLVAHRRFPT